MAVVSTTLDWQGITAGEDKTKGYATLTYDVEVTSVDTMAYNILYARDAAGIPAVNDRHPLDGWLFCTSKTASPESQTMVKVICNFESIENPLDQEPEVWWTFATSTEKLDVDRDGNPMVNSADEPLDLDVEIIDKVYHCRFNSAVFDVDIASDYEGSVNSDVWRNFDPGKCKCVKYLGEPKRVGNDFYYFEITIEIQIRNQYDDDSWVRKVKDEGYRLKTGTDADGKPTYETITDDNGNPISEPVALDGEGQKLADGADVVFNEFWTAREMPFTDLNLPE